MNAPTTTVVDRRTGEVLDVRESSDEDLAVFIDNLDELRAELAEAQAIVDGELLSRLDRSASWTRRVRVGDVEYEISAPSPDAGTEAYDEHDLEGELRKLVERGTIDESAAALALERTLSLQLRVPLDADLQALVDAVKHATDIELAGVAVEPLKVDASRSVKLGGVAKLRKVDGTGAALDRAKRSVAPRSRKPKVKRKTKER